MDENTPTDNQNKPQGVMDVQPPKPAAPEATSVPAAPAPAPVPQPDIGVSQAVQDATEHPPAAEAPKPAGLSPDLLAQAKAETEVNKPQAPADAGHQLPAHANKKKKPMLVIIIAVVVALALSGVAVYAYMASQEDKKSNDHSTDTSQEHTGDMQDDADQPPATPATTQDVDDAVKAADEAVNSADEAQDLPDGGLSDQTTGL